MTSATKKLMREFVDAACECEVRDYLISEYAERIEQAIAATLGSGTCEVETTESWLPAERYHRCKHCGAFFAVMDASADIQPCCCPNCGKAVTR